MAVRAQLEGFLIWRGEGQEEREAVTAEVGEGAYHMMAALFCCGIT